LAFGAVLKLALAADTVSIAIMEIVDIAIMLVIPGAMDAGLTDPLFWGLAGGGTGDRGCRGLSGQPLSHRARAGTRCGSCPPSLKLGLTFQRLEQSRCAATW
jgi:hypothetical protein